ncbi:MAG: hypothetical protein R3E12_03555 [Candidatus Eisenbacteria bacterium]
MVLPNREVVPLENASVEEDDLFPAHRLAAGGELVESAAEVVGKAGRLGNPVDEVGGRAIGQIDRFLDEAEDSAHLAIDDGDASPLVLDEHSRLHRFDEAGETGTHVGASSAALHHAADPRHHISGNLPTS